MGRDKSKSKSKSSKSSSKSSSSSNSGRSSGGFGLSRDSHGHVTGTTGHVSGYNSSYSSSSSSSSSRSSSGGGGWGLSHYSSSVRSAQSSFDRAVSNAMSNAAKNDSSRSTSRGSGGGSRSSGGGSSHNYSTIDIGNYVPSIRDGRAAFEKSVEKTLSSISGGGLISGGHGGSGSHNIWGGYDPTSTEGKSAIERYSSSIRNGTDPTRDAMDRITGGSSHNAPAERGPSPSDVISKGTYGGFTVVQHRDGTLTWSEEGKPSYTVPGTSGKDFAPGWATGGKDPSSGHSSGTISAPYVGKKSSLTAKGVPLGGSWGETAEEIAETLSKKHELEKQGFTKQDEFGQYKEHVFIESSINTWHYVREYADGSRRTVKTQHGGDHSYRPTKQRKEITVPEKNVNSSNPKIDIEKQPLGPHDKILPDGTIIHELEPDPKVYVDVSRNLYTFGIDKLQIAHKKPIKTSAWISQEMEIGHSSFIELSAKTTKANSSIEYSVIENGIEYPICPVETKEIKNEKIFKGLPTRFTPHPDYKITIKKNGMETQNTIHTIKNIDFGSDLYTIDYTPIRQSYHYFPETTKIKIKVVERCYDDYLPAAIKSIVILKHGGGKLWSI